MADKDPAEKLKARLSQWQEYVGDLQERAPRLEPEPVVPGFDAQVAPATDPLHAVVTSPETIRTAAPLEQPAWEPQPVSAAPEVGAPADPHVQPARPHQTPPLKRLVVERIETGDADYGRTGSQGPYPFGPKPVHTNGHGGRNGASQGVHPDGWRDRYTDEWLTGMRPGHTFSHARLVNVILCVCILVLIALIVGLATFILNR